MTPKEVIEALGLRAHNISTASGCDGVSVAGSLVSYFLVHPDKLEPFLRDEIGFCELENYLKDAGLSWRGRHGQIVTPEQYRAFAGKQSN